MPQKDLQEVAGVGTRCNAHTVLRLLEFVFRHHTIGKVTFMHPIGNPQHVRREGYVIATHGHSIARGITLAI